MKNTNIVRLTEENLKKIVADCVIGILSENDDFYEKFYMKYLKRKQVYEEYSGYGFNLKKDGKWCYDDMEYDPRKREMSCFGLSVKVFPGMKLRDVETDLFELLLDNGYENE